jgi:hypothetical protein
MTDEIGPEGPREPLTRVRRLGVVVAMIWAMCAVMIQVSTHLATDTGMASDDGCVPGIGVPRDHASCSSILQEEHRESAGLGLFEGLGAIPVAWLLIYAGFRANRWIDEGRLAK